MTDDISMDSQETEQNPIELWFDENLELKEGRSMRMRIKEQLDSQKSYFQQLDVYQTECFGKMLSLDGVIQTTEFDEAHYHEMLTHVPLLTHPNPKKVLIIGGGDGGIAREVLKHKTVEEVHMCELDKAVCDISKKHLPSIAKELNNPKLKLFFEDGAKFVAQKKDVYDIILVDSTDPIGPGKILFQPPFYEAMKNALTDTGIIVTQSESMFYHEKIIRGLFKFQKEMFPVHKYYHSMIPTYPSGGIGFSFCSKAHNPLANIDAERAEKIEATCRYYTSDIHKASFALPHFAMQWIPYNLDDSVSKSGR